MLYACCERQEEFSGRESGYESAIVMPRNFEDLENVKTSGEEIKIKGEHVTRIEFSRANYSLMASSRSCRKSRVDFGKTIRGEMLRGRIFTEWSTRVPCEFAVFAKVLRKNRERGNGGGEVSNLVRVTSNEN